MKTIMAGSHGNGCYGTAGDCGWALAPLILLRNIVALAAIAFSKSLN